MPDGDHGVGGDIAVGLGLGDDDAGRLVLEHPRVVPHGIPVPEALGVLQIEPEGHVVLDREAGAESGPVRIER